ncbi:uncharacterized protein LOC144121478 [Amblyomma americanum]
MRQASGLDATFEGFKGPSPLLRLKGLDLVWGLPPDYMHCVLEGVTKQLVEQWLSVTGTAFYIGRHVRLLDSRLCTIKPPINFSRIARPLLERAYWKATEWRYWLLFYSVPCFHSFPCLSDLLPRPYMVHFALLVKALFLLLQDTISESDISTAEVLLLSFVQQVARLYGDTAMTFNVHQLLHLPKATRMFGPLWGLSTFPFEDEIGRTLRLVSAAKLVPMQVAERTQTATEHVLSVCRTLFQNFLST